MEKSGHFASDFVAALKTATFDCQKVRFQILPAIREWVSRQYLLNASEPKLGCL
jgi:hypothetical protein